MLWYFSGTAVHRPLAGGGRRPIELEAGLGPRGKRRAVGFEPLQDAVVAERDGLLWVDYGLLGFIPDDFAAMRAEGEAAVTTHRPRNACWGRARLQWY
mgnify:CR=1 FL=1